MPDHPGYFPTGDSMHPPTPGILSFREMYQRQQYLQTFIYLKELGDVHPFEYTDEQKIQFIKDNKLALDAEVQEMLDECGWKPWASSKHINVEAFKGEIVDAFHFLMNEMMVVGMTVDELLTGYDRKSFKNIKRQEDGYDGVSTKCPGCHRALDDTAVKCHETGVFWAANAHVFWCDQLAKEVSRPLREEN